MDPVIGEEAGLTADAQALLDAVIAIGSDLDMHHVLDRIVVSACALTGAQYGALGVLGASGGELSDFIAHGIDDATRSRIGDLPHGRGILGLLIKHPEPLRLARLQDHPASYGFPAHHPPMKTFLGVPIRVRGTVFGNLYLTEKADGGDFTAADEALVMALASAAGFVVENARAYAASEQQRTWLEAVSRLNDSLQRLPDLESAARHVAIGAREVSGGRAVAVVRMVDEGLPTVLASDGRDEARLPEALPQLHPAIQLAAAGKQPDPVELQGGLHAIAAPIRTQLLAPMVLVVVGDRATTGTGHPERSIDLIRSFAEQTALALDRIQALEDRQELAVLSDRDRIARDLHDLVIQRLFATGLQLQGAQARAGTPALRDRLSAAVRELDSTIQDIRRTIFELQHAGMPSLRASVADLVREYVPILGFAPRVRTDGPLDTVVPTATQEQLIAVLREALSNIAKHARATSAGVDIVADVDHVRLTVTDDGVGLPERRHESGLRNLHARAQELRGTLRLHPAEPHGTVLDWRVPLEAQSEGTTATGTSE